MCLVQCDNIASDEDEDELDYEFDMKTIKKTKG